MRVLVVAPLAALLLAAPAAAAEQETAEDCLKIAVHLDQAERQIARYQGSDKQMAYASSLAERTEANQQGFLDECLLPRPCYAFNWDQGAGKGYVQAWKELADKCAHQDK